MTPPTIAVGQQWRRISDGAEVTVTLVDDSYIWYEYATGQTSYFRPSIFRARFDGPIGPQESK